MNSLDLLNGTPSKFPLKAVEETSNQCERCKAPIESKVGYPDLCDDCVSLSGACCQDWEEETSHES